MPAKLGRAVLCTILLNLPYWIIADRVFISRAAVSVDSLLALLLLQFTCTLGMVAIAASWLADLLVSLSLTYHFSSPVEFLRSTQFADHLDLSSYLASSAALLFTLPFVASALVLERIGARRTGAWPIIVLMITLIVLDALNGSSALSARAVRVVGTNIAGSSLHAIVGAAIDDRRNAESPPKLIADGGPDEVLGLLPDAFSTDRGFLYVIIESFGVHESPAVRDWLARQLQSETFNRIYEVTTVEKLSQGGTTAGELRRLCSLSGSYRQLGPDSTASCLPRRLQSAGWKVHGFHGFSSGMFNRQHWWPLIGIKDAHYAEDLGQIHSRRCGAAFRGICDDELISDAVQATQLPKSFVYALTLNTHLPLAPIEPSAGLSSLCAAERVGDDVCTLLAHLETVLRALSSSLTQAAHPPTVVLVGDHPPPFSDKHSRTQFKSGMVPMLALHPRRTTEEPASKTSLSHSGSPIHAQSGLSQ